MTIWIPSFTLPHIPSFTLPHIACFQCPIFVLNIYIPIFFFFEQNEANNHLDSSFSPHHLACLWCPLLYLFNIYILFFFFGQDEANDHLDSLLHSTSPCVPLVPADLAHLVGGHKVCVLDCRNNSEVRAGRLKGSLNLGYIFVYIYTCIYIYICVCIYMCICVCVCVCIAHVWCILWEATQCVRLTAAITLRSARAV